MLLLKKLPCRLAGNRGARGSGDTSKNVIVGSGDKKGKFFKPQSKLGENFKLFSGHAGQNRSPSDSGPEGFQEKQSTSAYCPSFLRHVPAYVAEEFKDPEFCKSVAGLERMLRVRARSHSDKSPAHLAGTCLSNGERKGSLMPDLVAVSQECSLDRSHDGVSVPDPAEFVFVAHPSAVSVGDSSVEALADQVVESTATGKHDLEDGIVAVCHHPSVESFGGRAHASFPATASDGNRSRLLEVIESVFSLSDQLC